MIWIDSRTFLGYENESCFLNSISFAIAVSVLSLIPGLATSPEVLMICSWETDDLQDQG